MTVANSPDAPAPVRSSSSRAEMNRRVESLRLSPEVVHGGSGTWLGWVLSLVIVGTVVWLVSENARRPVSDGLAKSGAPTSNPVPSRDVNSKPAEPKNADSAAAVGEFALESKGYVIPAHQIRVSPQVGGRLLKLLIEEGQRVHRNQVLAEIEKTEYLAEVQRVEALLESARQRLLELQNGNRPEEISQAESELAEVNAQLPQLEAEYRRNKELRATGTISELDFEKADSAYQSMLRRSEKLGFAMKVMKDGPRPERIAVAKAEVAQLDAELIKAKWKLDNCTVRAPVAGTVLVKNAEEGSIVNPIAPQGSFSICEIADLADLEVDLNIQERDIARVFVGQKCEVRAEAYPKRVYRGEVARLMPIADRAKGAIPIRVKLVVPAEEEGVYLRPQMSVIVAFLSPERSAAEAQTTELPIPDPGK